MTRAEFLENVNDFIDLREFCNDNGCDYCEYVYTYEERDDLINEDIDYYQRYESWREVFRYLEGIDMDSRADWWSNEDGWAALSDEDFERYKSDVLQWADQRGGIFDEEEVYDPEDLAVENTSASEPEEEIEPFEAEDFSCGELWSAAAAVYATENARIEEETERMRQEISERQRILDENRKSDQEKLATERAAEEEAFIAFMSAYQSQHA